MGPDVAEMAFRQNTEFEMLHRIRVLFRTNDLTMLGKPSLSTKIEVNRISVDGSDREVIESTEVIKNSMQPQWIQSVVIDYSVRDTDFYSAMLIDMDGESETVLGEAKFKLAELITSHGEFVFKVLETKDIILEMKKGSDDGQSEGGHAVPVIGIMGIEEKDDEQEAIEFSLQIQQLPAKTEASFFQIQRQIGEDEFELEYESKFQNPIAETLSFDVASIFLNKIIVENPKYKCRLQLFTIKK